MTVSLGARTTRVPLSESINLAVEDYFDELKGSMPVELYKLFLGVWEPALLKKVMECSRYNQCRAAKMLGISRGTLRCKLRQYFGDKYVGTRQ